MTDTARARRAESTLRERLAGIPWIRRVELVQTTGSTNDDARRLAESGAPEGSVVLAEAQTAGRGRLGRVWHSPAGVGCYLSLLLRPQEPASQLGRYAIVAAVAVCAACRALGATATVIKWPNDLVARGRKLAGILAELRATASGPTLIVGVGVNVEPLPAQEAGWLDNPATSLREERGGILTSRDDAAVAVLSQLALGVSSLRRGGWSELSGTFLGYAPAAEGAGIRLADGRHGVTRGLHGSGALQVATDSGIILLHGADSIAGIWG